MDIAVIARNEMSDVTRIQTFDRHDWAIFEHFVPAMR
jgi:hypothetical protein